MSRVRTREKQEEVPPLSARVCVPTWQSYTTVSAAGMKDDVHAEAVRWWEHKNPWCCLCCTAAPAPPHPRLCMFAMYQLWVSEEGLKVSAPTGESHRKVYVKTSHWWLKWWSRWRTKNKLMSPRGLVCELKSLFFTMRFGLWVKTTVFLLEVWSVS